VLWSVYEMVVAPVFFMALICYLIHLHNTAVFT
jgi:hypothetical protein